MTDAATPAQPRSVPIGEEVQFVRDALRDQPAALAVFESHIGHDREALGFVLAANIGPIRVAAIEAQARPAVASEGEHPTEAFHADHPWRALDDCAECGGTPDCHPATVASEGLAAALVALRDRVRGAAYKAAPAWVYRMLDDEIRQAESSRGVSAASEGLSPVHKAPSALAADAGSVGAPDEPCDQKVWGAPQPLYRGGYCPRCEKQHADLYPDLTAAYKDAERQGES